MLLILFFTRGAQGLGASLRAVDSMYQNGVSIPKGIFYDLLKECLKTRRSIFICKEIHSRILRSNLASDPFLGSLLIRLFATNGRLSDANSIFEKIQEPTELAWNTIIFANAKLGDSNHAMDLYCHMQERNVWPGANTFVAVLKACCDMKSLDHGRSIHIKIVEYGYEARLYVINILVDMYGKCGSLLDANVVQNNAKFPDVVTWSALIGGYAQDGFGEEAINLFYRMQEEGICSNNITFVSTCQACSCIGILPQGKRIHVYIAMCCCRGDVFVNSALVDMYMKCGSVKDAQKVFDGSIARNVITWGAMISGYVHHGLNEEALLLYSKMQQEGIKPNNITHNSLLMACSRMKVSDRSKPIHDELWRNGLKLDVAQGNTLIDMYAKEGNLSSAHVIFDLLPQRDRVTWNTLIVAYAQHDQGEEALRLFQRMPYEVMDMDKVFYLGVVKACSSIGALEIGKLLHNVIVEISLEANISMGSSLVDMYVKCNRLGDASITFSSLSKRDVIAWGAMITGHAQYGGFTLALRYFHKMQIEEGLKPNEVIFSSLLSACSHLGFGAEGQELFKMMQENYGVTPSIAHYNCLVDLFARAGKLDEARDVLITMPYRCNIIGWTSLLEHAKSYVNLELLNACIDHG